MSSLIKQPYSISLIVIVYKAILRKSCYADGWAGEEASKTERHRKEVWIRLCDHPS